MITVDWDQVTTLPQEMTISMHTTILLDAGITVSFIGTRPSSRRPK